MALFGAGRRAHHPLMTEASDGGRQGEMAGSPADAERRIVVGVDGSPSSRQALRWAAGQAALEGAVLHALHIEPYQFETNAVVSPAGTPEAAADLASDIARHEVEDVLGSQPAVAVMPEGTVGLAAEELLRASKGADLLVVGSRGRGGFSGLLLGSVSQQVVHHAECPVVVVRVSVDT